MKRSEYKQLLDLFNLLETQAKVYLTSQGIDFDFVSVLSLQSSFVIVKITYKGQDDFSYINLFNLLEDKECTSC